jgi:hypothetical protein
VAVVKKSFGETAEKEEFQELEREYWESLTGRANRDWLTERGDNRKGNVGRR